MIENQDTTTASTIQNICDAIRGAVVSMPDISLAVLFGSAACGRLRFDSDVDVAIAGESNISLERQQEIRIALSRKLRREVDIIDLRQARGLIFYQALTKGIIVMARDQRLLARMMTDVVYYAADMLPLVTAALANKTSRFING